MKKMKKMKKKMMKYKALKHCKLAIAYAFTFSLVFGMLLAGCGLKAAPTAADNNAAPPAETESAEQDTDTADGTKEDQSDMTNPTIEITMVDGGVITLELDPAAAPITVANFLKLVDDKYYDGLTFHRIIPGFMIQGGCPLGTGTGGSDKKIKGEFSANGHENPISHKRGVISMARSQDMNSASCQFFITNADSAFLDGNYAAFGIVTSGMDVVDEISAVPTGANDKPDTPVVIKSIRRI
jgi:peptidyl-prolyl cis-trans isomerase B (cyclophilin B)